MNKTRFVKALLLLLAVSMLASCAPRSTPREVKIALIAPFEGQGRSLGYSALAGVKLALQEADHRLPNGEIVSLVALNDDYTPRKAARQVRTASADPAVLAIIGPWSRATATAASDALHPEDPAMIVPAPLPDDRLSPRQHRLFADDRSIARTAEEEAHSIGGCGVNIEGKLTPEGKWCTENEAPRWLMACCDAMETATAVTD